MKRTLLNQSDDSVDLTVERNYKRIKTLTRSNTGTEEYRYSRFPINGPCLPLTSDDGLQLFIRLRPENKNITNNRKSLYNNNSNGILSTSINYLMDKLHDEEVNNIYKDQLQINKENNNNNNNNNEEDKNKKSELWVDKYTPKKFTDLLSDEVNIQQIIIIFYIK